MCPNHLRAQYLTYSITPQFPPLPLTLIPKLNFTDLSIPSWHTTWAFYIAHFHSFFFFLCTSFQSKYNKKYDSFITDIFLYMGFSSFFKLPFHRHLSSISFSLCKKLIFAPPHNISTFLLLQSVIPTLCLGQSVKLWCWGKAKDRWQCCYWCWCMSANLCSTCHLLNWQRFVSFFLFFCFCC